MCALGSCAVAQHSFYVRKHCLQRLTVLLPQCEGVKYLKISAYVTALVELVQSTNAREGVAKKASGVNGGPEARADIILHEPGFLHLLPVLSQSLGSRARIVCLADDFLQVDHLDR